MAIRTYGFLPKEVLLRNILILALLMLSQINKEAMEEALSPDMLATDLANYLVRKGVSIQRLREEG